MVGVGVGGVWSLIFEFALRLVREVPFSAGRLHQAQYLDEMSAHSVS